MICRVRIHRGPKKPFRPCLSCYTWETLETTTILSCNLPHSLKLDVFSGSSVYLCSGNNSKIPSSLLCLIHNILLKRTLCEVKNRIYLVLKILNALSQLKYHCFQNLQTPCYLCDLGVRDYSHTFVTK